MKRGLWYALGAYAIWGIFPLYWKQLHQVDAVQLIGHRIAWSFIILITFVAATRQVATLVKATFKPRVLMIYMVAAVLIGVNWLMYVWAVNAGFIVETSLGYFINPLLSVLMGVIFLRERLRLSQWISIALASVGVIYLTLAYGRLPWIALTLAFTFGTYGLVKKISPLGSLFGLTIETGLLFLPALIYLVFVNFSGSGAFLHEGIFTDVLLVGAGAVTTIPLLMFATAAQSIPLSMVGVMQYIAPTLQFLLGVFVYKEDFDRVHLVGFGIVWIALILFIVEGLLAQRYVRQEPIPEIGEG